MTSKMVIVLLHTEKNCFIYTHIKQTSLAFVEIKIIPWEIIVANTYTVLSLCWALFNALCILINPILTKP